MQVQVQVRARVTNFAAAAAAADPAAAAAAGALHWKTDDKLACEMFSANNFGAAAAAGSAVAQQPLAAATKYTPDFELGRGSRTSERASEHNTNTHCE